ncbi:phosphorothioated DNA-binding restriction endonuclease [Ammoniphilus resinae]|uniref:Restriction endonuclease n=1 Tax=Ammoniphilus resinae TaxID=861532 RepID=A0ABS4GSK8_9BACL|nr:HNH endonuclease [Ammoniphilus resinae]MBP1933239.1 putative restriction endonuclease [Ammoniphilus resinae]
MNLDELTHKISNLTIWKKNGQRAPHKPLLILYALGQYQNFKKIDLPYEEVRYKLKNLLIEFGPPRKSYHPEEPFVRLVRDEVWELNTQVDIRKFSDKQLLTSGVVGGFNKDVINLLQNDPQLIKTIALQLLEDHFPDTMHNDILDEVGLDFSVIRKRPRDPMFREKVLRAYEYSCMVCGFNVRLGKNSLALEAAHIKWHNAGGPDAEDNGVALCSMHHKLFDYGAFTITEKSEMLVSEEAYGTNGFEDWLMRFHGKTLRGPIRPEYSPKEVFLNWHVREVFKGKSRYRYS